MNIQELLHRFDLNDQRTTDNEVNCGTDNTMGQVIDRSGHLGKTSWSL
jgi:hypothetical protein